MDFNYTVVEYTPDYFSIQLKFKTPVYISSNGKNNLDKVIVTAVANEFWFSQKSKRSIEEGTYKVQSLPPQLVGTAEAQAGLIRATEAAATATKSILQSMGVLNIFLSASLNLLWGMVNALQIISHLPYFNVAMPANVIDFF